MARNLLRLSAFGRPTFREDFLWRFANLFLHSRIAPAFSGANRNRCGLAGTRLLEGKDLQPAWRSHEHQLRTKEMTEPVVNSPAPAETVASNDEQLLKSLGYKQELARRMSGFSNFAISLSIICILAGGITSFHVGFRTVGGASIGIGWIVGGVFALIVAASLGQIGSAYPTAGGLYHWSSIL